MSLSANHQASSTQPWLPPPHIRSRDVDGPGGAPPHTLNGHAHDPIRARSHTPLINLAETPNGGETGYTGEGDSALGEEDPKSSVFRELYARSEAKLAALFGSQHGREDVDDSGVVAAASAQVNGVSGQLSTMADATPKRRVARGMEDDDYGDVDDDDDDDAPAAPIVRASTPPKLKTHPSSFPSPSLAAHRITGKPISRRATSSQQDQGRSSEEVRKKLEGDKKAAEDAAKRSFHTLFYTLENDRDAMLEQQKLEELDRQVDAEMSSHGAQANQANATAGTEQQGKLSSVNLGASSLTLKHLIARIDAKRDQVRASDQELRSLMSEVRKNRSKWASEERVGQEELYEAADKVLSELKAMTQHSTAFLTRVNKRDAPDYHTIIKQPMDLGTMTKRLKTLAYRSKKEFVDEINLIWSNCLRYNADPTHFLRKHAIAMKKETDKLVPLIPDIVIRSRAEVEAEERRMQNGGADVDANEESDDESIMSSRGRKAPGKQAKKGAAPAPSVGLKTPGGLVEETAGSETKANGCALDRSSSATLLRRAGSDAPMEASQTGLSTPPLGGIGSVTPAGLNGVSTHPHPAVETMEVDGFGSSVHGLGLVPQGASLMEDIEVDDLEYKTWKQVTKKDRARVAAERHRLFKDNQLNVEEPALLRTKAGMRRWLRNQREAVADGATQEGRSAEDAKEGQAAVKGGETLAEGMEGEEERVLPDYYDTVAAIPELPQRLRWEEDAEGVLIDQSDEFLRLVSKGLFTSPQSALTTKMEANMRQMQETRRICSKIGVIKQMQLQSQMYQNQFQKYQPSPFMEADIEPMVVSDDGPIMAPWVCRATLQRSVAKIFYHAGFEEFQPSALDAVTDMAGGFFNKLAQTFGVYHEASRVAANQSSTASTAPDAVGIHPTTTHAATVTATSTATSATTATSASTAYRPRFNEEDVLLHTLHENGLDVESLECYVKDDVERLGSKLLVMHERMKAHLADLLRPALADGGPDGSRAFADGSETFTAGSFASSHLDDEDFFGFKELGLDREFNLSSLGVPLHLLQNRMHNAYVNAQGGAGTAVGPGASVMDNPTPHEPVTISSLKNEIGLVKNWFLAKLHANGDEPLVEDEDLPVKQRFPKPRLGPTGKIMGARKRPAREQGKGRSEATKKRKGDADGEAGSHVGVGRGNGKKAKLSGVAGKVDVDEMTKKRDAMLARDNAGGKVGPKGANAGSDLDDGPPATNGLDKGGPMSPESIIAA